MAITLNFIECNLEMNKQRRHRFVHHYWYRKTILSYLFLPFSIVFRAIISLRRFLYCKKILKATQFEIPVIIVGNIAVGGTGKTPFVIWLANLLKQHGYQPGIVSRGYGGKAKNYPIAVTAKSDPLLVGDEPVLIARNTQCPIIVAPDRVAAVNTLLQENNCNIVISDDGLQHYALGRTLEIAIIDGERRIGNGFCLPAGPLREPAKRLQEVDFIVCNGQPHFGEKGMKLIASDFRQVSDPTVTQPAVYFKNKNVHAVAAIGNPSRFFNLVRVLGIDIIEHAFPDHHHFTAADISFGVNALVLMTEKDAVKCEAFAAGKQFWYLPVTAKVSDDLADAILAKLKS